MVHRKVYSVQQPNP